MELPYHAGLRYRQHCLKFLPTAEKRGVQEASVHRSCIPQRKKLKKAILFIDRASCHGTDEVRRFLGRHPETAMKSLPKKDPSANPVELLVNRRMSSFVQSNRCYYNRDELKGAGGAFLSSYNAFYAAG